MPIDIGLLKIDGAIFHPVPRRDTPGPDGNPETPVISTVESELNAPLEFFLRDRLTKTFTTAAQPIARDDEVKSPAPDLVITALTSGSQSDIVKPFQVLPALLLEVQAHNSPRGLLTVIRGSCGKQRVIVLVKVEQERGLSYDTITEGNEVRVQLVVEDGLVFTEKTEVFKAAIFYIEGGELRGLLTDDQTGSVYKGPSSHYWLSDFLGCRYTRDADVQTRAWIRATQRLIRSDIEDAAEKDAVLSAMLAELSSNRNDINPARFIQNYVPAAAQDAALTRLRNEGAPTTAFPKSRDVSSHAPSKKRISFDNGYEVTMPADVEPDLDTEFVDDTQIDVLTIRGHIRNVGA